MDKMKLRYLGLMVVLQCTRNGAYQLAELDSAVSRLCYAAFRLIPYHARSLSFITVTHIVNGNDLTSHNNDDTSVGGAGLSNDELT